MAGAIISITESKSNCIGCGENFPINILEPKWIKSKRSVITHTCKKCKRKNAITCNFMGDFVSFEL